LDGPPGLLPVDCRGQEWEPGVPVVPGSQHHQGTAARQAPKPKKTFLMQKDVD
jgi:hypothetical protein